MEDGEDDGCFGLQLFFATDPALAFVELKPAHELAVKALDVREALPAVDLGHRVVVSQRVTEGLIGTIVLAGLAANEAPRLFDFAPLAGSDRDASALGATTFGPDHGFVVVHVDALGNLPLTALTSALAHDICERSEPKWFLDNARLESFGLHARQQASFYFESSPPRARNAARADGDLFATDFFDDPVEWQRLRGRRPDELHPDNLGRRFSKEMAHPTFERRNYKDQAQRPMWSVFKIFTALAPVVEEFAEAVDDARLVDDFSQRVQKAQPLKQPPPPVSRGVGPSGVAATREQALIAAAHATRGLSPHDLK